MRSVVVGVVFVLLFPLVAEDARGADAWMEQGTLVEPPPGFISFCMRNPEQCRSDGAQPVLHFDGSLENLLRRINDSVNRNTKWTSDLADYGRREFYALITDGRGDCDDMVVTKRALLHAAGIPLGDLRITIAQTLQGAGHAVLTVTTDKGDYVLDSLEPSVRRWDTFGYKWIERQDGTSFGWASIEGPADIALAGQAAPVAAAAAPAASVTSAAPACPASQVSACARR